MEDRYSEMTVELADAMLYNAQTYQLDAKLDYPVRWATETILKQARRCVGTAASVVICTSNTPARMTVGFTLLRAGIDFMVTR